MKWSRANGRECSTKGSRRAAPAALHLLDGARPVLPEQTRERAIRHQSAGSLTPGTVVGLVLRVHDALNGKPARGTRLAIPSVYGHSFAERGHAFGELAMSLATQELDPVLKRAPGRLVEAPALLVGELASEPDG